MFKLSKEKGPEIEVIREYVVHLIAGKQIIGYHLPQKMADFGLLDLTVGSNEKRTWGECFDVAKIFNANNAAQQQPLSILCDKYLNLSYKKRPSPFFAFTEAKISMALFKQWIKLTKNPSPSNLSMSAVVV